MGALMKSEEVLPVCFKSEIPDIIKSVTMCIGGEEQMMKKSVFYDSSGSPVLFFSHHRCPRVPNIFKSTAVCIVGEEQMKRKSLNDAEVGESRVIFIQQPPILLKDYVKTHNIFTSGSCHLKKLEQRRKLRPMDLHR
jgi:hypothetical protein